MVEGIATMTRPEQDTSPAGFPYNTRLNVLHGPLEVIDVAGLVEACTDHWYNQTLCRVDESVVRLGVVQGEYHWHHHEWPRSESRSDPANQRKGARVRGSRRGLGVAPLDGIATLGRACYSHW